MRTHLRRCPLLLQLCATYATFTLLLEFRKRILQTVWLPSTARSNTGLSRLARKWMDKRFSFQETEFIQEVSTLKGMDKKYEKLLLGI
jgi:hypothetical protein